VIVRAPAQVTIRKLAETSPKSGAYSKKGVALCSTQLKTRRTPRKLGRTQLHDCAEPGARLKRHYEAYALQTLWWAR